MSYQRTGVAMHSHPSHCKWWGSKCMDLWRRAIFFYARLYITLSSPLLPDLLQIIHSEGPASIYRVDSSRRTQTSGSLPGEWDALLGVLRHAWARLAITVPSPCGNGGIHRWPRPYVALDQKRWRRHMPRSKLHCLLSCDFDIGSFMFGDVLDLTTPHATHSVTTI